MHLQTFERLVVVHTLSVDSTPTAHHIFPCTVVAQFFCQSVQSHIDPMHLHGSSDEPRCLRFAPKHSH